MVTVSLFEILAGHVQHIETGLSCGRYQVSVRLPLKMHDFIFVIDQNACRGIGIKNFPFNHRLNIRRNRRLIFFYQTGLSACAS